jgi:excisionase family DNA binding protein
VSPTDPETPPVKLALTVEETCEALTISRPTFYRLVRDGELKAIKIAGRTVVTTAELQRFLDTRLSA